MTKEDKSTKRPWAVNWAGTDYWIECADNEVNVATVETQYNDGEADLSETKANASLIVTAVNERDAHLKCAEALKEIAANTYGTEPSNTDWENYQIVGSHLLRFQKIAREALALLSPAQEEKKDDN